MDRESFHPYRPTIEEKLYYFQQMKKGNGTEEGDLELNIQELKELAQGQGEKETKDQWYSGWTQEDFEALLQKLEEEGIVE
ncbi:hypothetical protein HYV70_04280 [Candidatus Uhrbacteria bacterium]|nr:hypothetical protein [Candidatus Uhrbacteria bacterium]